jgi:hypothetical protein
MPRAKISSLNETGTRMNSEVIDLKPFVRRQGEVLLAKDVLDNQLIDVDGKRVVRVNDVQIIEVAGEWRVSGADVSLQGFMRRLMPNGFYFAKRPVEVIDWADVGYLATDKATAAVRLKSSKDKLARLHPVEIAQLAEASSPIHRTEIVESLDDEIAADTWKKCPRKTRRAFSKKWTRSAPPIFSKRCRRTTRLTCLAKWTKKRRRNFSI